MKLIAIILIGIIVFSGCVSEVSTEKQKVVFEGEKGLELREPDYSGCMKEVGNTWVCNELFKKAIAKEEGLVSFEYAKAHYQEWECINGTVYDWQGREFYPSTHCIQLQEKTQGDN